MISITRFTINDNAYIDILVPEFPHKDNYYYPPTERLHIYDIVTIIYCNSGIETTLFEDAVGLCFEMLKNILTHALINKQILPSSIELGQASLSFSFDEQNNNNDIDYKPLWLWSSPSKIQTWLYTRNNKIYLEISYTYPWLFSDPEPSENYFSFDEYAANYNPIVVHELTIEMAQQWIQQSESILSILEKPSLKCNK